MPRPPLTTHRSRLKRSSLKSQLFLIENRPGIWRIRRPYHLLGPTSSFTLRKENEPIRGFLDRKQACYPGGNPGLPIRASTAPWPFHLPKTASLRFKILSRPALARPKWWRRAISVVRCSRCRHIVARGTVVVIVSGFCFCRSHTCTHTPAGWPVPAPSQFNCPHTIL